MDSPDIAPPAALRADARRRALPRRLQVIVLAVVFASGAVVGALLATNVVYSRLQHYRQHPETLPDKMIGRLQRKLSLDDDQKEQVHAILKRRHSRIVDIYQQAAPEIHAEFDHMEREILAELDEVQAGAFHEIAERVRLTFLPPKPDR